MARDKHYFSSDYLDKLAAKKSQRYERGDTGCLGLIVRVEPSGTKSLYAQYKIYGAHQAKVGVRGQRLAGPAQRILLGRWPYGITLPEARRKTHEFIGDARVGRDPKARLNSVCSDALSVLVPKYIEFSGTTRRSTANTESAFRVHILPKLGSRSINTITHHEINKILDPYIAIGKAGTARKIRNELRALFNYAIQRGHLSSNPAALIKRNDLAARPSPGRPLSDPELKAVWAACTEMGYPYGDLYKVLIMTGQRFGDWARSSWAEVQDNVLLVPAERYKTARAHAVPLSEAVIAILDGLPRWADGNFIFSTRRSHGAIPADNTKPAVRLSTLAQAELRRQLDDKKANLPHFRIHDFRHNCKTRLSKLGAPPEVRDAILGHAKQGMDRIYDHHDFLDEKRTWLGKYATAVLTVVDLSSACPNSPALDDFHDGIVAGVYLSSRGPYQPVG